MEKQDEITRRSFLGMGGAATISGLIPGNPAMAQSRAEQPKGQSTGIRKRPNMILYMPDELRADALACYGNPLVKTPNFDALAKGGTRFANCHVQFPVCGQSRCSLLTGWPASIRGHRSLFYFLRPEEPNLFRNLRRAGYDVFWLGKNDALSAEVFYESVSRWDFQKPVKRSREPRQPPNAPNTFIRGRNASSDDPREDHDYSCVQAAIELLERQERERPFCIFLALKWPHPPYGAPGRFYDMYRASQITGLRPVGLPKRPSYVNGIRKYYNLESASESTFREVRALYYGSVSYADWLFGQLLEGVDRTNHAADTAVFLLSDHGDYAGDYGLVEKWPSGLEDCLTHVPLIARAPGGTKGHTVENMVELYDVMATCLDLADAPAEHTNYARSLLPQMSGGTGDPRRAAHSEGGYNIYEPQCFEPFVKGRIYAGKTALQNDQPESVSRAAMIRTRDYKLVSRPQGQSELYSYREDPHELQNRFGETSVAAVQSELQERLLYWYLNTTGVSPKDKDQRGFPPYYPTPNRWTGEMASRILDEG